VCDWLLSAQTEIEELRSAAQLAGEKQGYEQAENFNQKLELLRQTMRLEAGSEIKKAAFAVAKNLLDAELNAFPDTVLRIAQIVLETIPDASQVYLRVNPSDAALLKDNREWLINALGRAKELDIRIDKQVERGGLLIQTESGVIDAQISTQLEEIARAIGGLHGTNN
jgi:flagellar biosynthesis/type III secretory pathway protein FliH